MKGTYVLLIDVRNPIDVTVGKLGRVAFKAGSYAYVGSAQNCLEKRVQRHLRKCKHHFWHIDYLLDQENASVSRVLFKVGHKEEECQTAKRIAEKSKPIKAFGCSDCKCKSHLFEIADDSTSLSLLDFAPLIISPTDTKA